MTKDEFINLLSARKIPTDIAIFDNTVKDGLCLRKVYFRWEVFFRERGQEYNVIGFPTESDALQYMYEKLLYLYNRNQSGDGSMIEP